MKALTVLTKYFNRDGKAKIMPDLDFKPEIDALSVAEKNELGALAAVELGVPFESQSE